MWLLYVIVNNCGHHKGDDRDRIYDIRRLKYYTLMKYGIFYFPHCIDMRSEGIAVIIPLPGIPSGVAIWGLNRRPLNLQSHTLAITPREYHTF